MSSENRQRAVSSTAGVLLAVQLVLLQAFAASAALCTVNDQLYATCNNICTTDMSLSFETTATCNYGVVSLMIYQSYCPMQSASTASVQPDNAFTYNAQFTSAQGPHSSSCTGNYSDSFTHDPADVLSYPSFDYRAIEGTFFGWAAAFVAAPIIMICLALLNQRDFESRCSRAVYGLTVCIILPIPFLWITNLTLSALYFKNCSAPALVDRDYSFDIYMGPPLSVNDSYTPTDPNVYSCSLSTALDPNSLLYTQYCTCTLVGGQQENYQWTGVNRYYNCQNYHQPVGCDQVFGWRHKARLAAIICSSVLVFCCLCSIFRERCSESGGSSSGGSGTSLSEGYRALPGYSAIASSDVFRVRVYEIERVPV